MSEVRRLDLTQYFKGDGICRTYKAAQMRESTIGEFVLYKDYAKLENQLSRTKAELEEYKLKYEGRDLVWFERHEVKGLDPEQTGFINLAEVRAKAVEECVALYTRKLGKGEKMDTVSIDLIKQGEGFIHPEGLLEYANDLRSQNQQIEE